MFGPVWSKNQLDKKPKHCLTCSFLHSLSINRFVSALFPLTNFLSSTYSAEADAAALSEVQFPILLAVCTSRNREQKRGQ